MSKWTAERIAELNDSDLKSLAENATRLNAEEIARLCAAELEMRAPVKRSRRTVGGPGRSPSEVVIGYHFVCERDRGVTVLDDGRFKSGSWVVAEDKVEQSIRHGAYLALHESKADPSYRQGKIVGYQTTERNMLRKDETKPQTRTGIEFLVEATDQSYDWVGDASGEKGYKWSDSAASDSPDG